MASISFEEVYSRFFTKAEAYDLIDEKYATIHREFLCNWLHSAINYPHIRRLFSSVIIDDEEETLMYEMRHKTDTMSDNEFVIEVLSYGMVYMWVHPKVNSITTITQTFGTSDEKWYSQAQHMSELRALRDDMEKKIRDMIGSRGYFNNDYLAGKAASALLRNKS